MKHYSNIGNNSIQIEPILYKPPIYGKSNTDQSYYEPTSSRIQNSYSLNKTTEEKYLTVEDAFKIPTKPNGITREEISVLYNDGKNNITNEIKEKNNKSKLDKTLESVSETLDTLKTSNNNTEN